MFDPTLSAPIESALVTARDTESRQPTLAPISNSRAVTVRLLNSMLATEMKGVVRHRRHHFMAKDLTPLYTGNEFLDCANDNQQRANKLAAHILELGGTPDLSPITLNECHHTQPIEHTTLKSLIAEDMIAQWNATEGYRNLIQYLGSRDQETRHVLVLILALDQRQKGEFARKILTQCAAYVEK